MTVLRQSINPLVGTMFVIELYLGIPGLDPEDGRDRVDIINQERDGSQLPYHVTFESCFFSHFPFDRSHKCLIFMDPSTWNPPTAQQGRDLSLQEQVFSLIRDDGMDRRDRHDLQYSLKQLRFDPFMG